MVVYRHRGHWIMFPISRDPPEGGTFLRKLVKCFGFLAFPISRDPPEGGTSTLQQPNRVELICCFQFLGIPPKGELNGVKVEEGWCPPEVSNF